MKSISVEYIRKRIENIHPRTRKAQINTFLGLIIKGGGVLISLILVPLTIDYLSKDTYGTWLTISSVVTMLNLLDIGIGNGLRNKFSEAVSKHNTELARAYVSTAYLIFGGLQLILIFLFVIIYRYIPWQRVFNTNINKDQLQTVILLTIVTIAIKLVLDILSSILFALHKSSQIGVINLLSNVLILLGTYTLTHFSKGNLIYLAAVSVVSPVVVIMISTFIFYKNTLNLYKPTLRLANLKYAKDLLSLGYKFFFIQISGVILFYTDNIIINQLFGPAEVTTYNIAFRYFNAISTIFAIAITPYWSAFTEAHIKGELEWMKQAHNYLQKIWLVLAFIVILMVISSNTVYTVWVGERVLVPLKLSICMGLFIIISSWNNIVAAIINGIGRVKLQLYFALFAAAINIPLALLFSRTFKMGSAGVILATSVSLLVCSGFGGLQAKKLVAGTAKGIWNQ